MTSPPQSPSVAPRVTPLWRVLTLSALVVLIDAWVLGQPLLTLFVLLWMLFVALPLTLRRKHAGIRLLRLRNIAIYLGAVVATTGLIVANAEMGQRRGEQIVGAVKSYHAQTERYPNTLDELVPEFLPSVPVARYTLSAPEFRYRLRDGKATLYYTTTMVYGGRMYDFEKGEWTELD